MQVTDKTFSKRVLLIGAGFSRNWGGLLAREVKEQILGHPAVKAHRSLQQMIIEEPSFEDALEKARAELPPKDARAIEAAIQVAFEAMDRDFQNPNPAVSPNTINRFILRFRGGGGPNHTGYVFSLNQDLLLERICLNCIGHRWHYPGIIWPGGPPNFAGNKPIPNALLDDPRKNEPLLRNNFNLIKLHGSINWRQNDGSSTMVMGRNKPQTIAQWPLMEWYHKLFERVLFDGDVKLMVIGYGWADEHINEPIANAVLKHRLEVYSWNPSDPATALKGKHKGDEISQGVQVFWTRKIKDVIPNDPINPPTSYYDGIVRDFF